MRRGDETAGPDRVVRLRAAGVDLVVRRIGTDLPHVVHWGADLGDMADDDLADLVLATTPSWGVHTVDEPRPVGVLASHADGWPGTPGLIGSRADGSAWSPRFAVLRDDLVEDQAGGGRYTVDAIDESAALAIRWELELSAQGLVRQRACVTNVDASRPWRLDSLSLTLPLPSVATEILDLTGRHGRERAPQRHELTLGTHARESRRGRPGHDSTLLLTVGVPGFGFQSGEVWSTHLAWSGNQRTFAERFPSGWGVLGAGELLLPGEVVLAPGENYDGPWVVASYGDGLDEMSARIHQFVRSRPQHPTSPRPVMLNTWEAVYFDHDLDTLLQLAKLASDVGVERFVLDDGWFLGRRDDFRGLGDWSVDPGVWPDGLTPLVEKVTGLGMQFGIWVEPEMVNPDSDLARAHPDWILSTGDRLPPESRHQQVLDLTQHDAWEHILERLDHLLSAHDISYVKWDHNRDLIDAGRSPHGEPAVRRQTLALYALLDELRRRHPGVEFESCAGGGGRIDLGILERTDRVWASDNIDPLERQQIQRWTGLLLPPELIGCHVASTRSHSTARSHSLNMRAGTAMFGHLGIEWDLRQATPDELDDLSTWVALYKQLRPLLHTGRTIRWLSRDGHRSINGVVSPDGGEAVVAVVQLATGVVAPDDPARIPGLDEARRYSIAALPPGDRLSFGQHEPPVSPWWARGSLTLSGKALRHVGVQLPQLLPEQLVLLHLRAVD